MRVVQVTLKHRVSRIMIAKWILKSGGYNSINAGVALNIADGLLDGETWTPTFLLGQGGMTVPSFLRIVEVDDGTNDYYYERSIRDKKIGDLLTRGAAGDAEAAIEYCKLELDGEIPHGAYA